MSGTFEMAALPPSVIRLTKVSTLVPVAASDLATDSVDGQRGRPSGVMRLDLLKVVGSRPAFFARPEGVSLARAASRSIAVHIWLCVSDMRASPSKILVQYIGIIAVSRPPSAIASWAALNMPMLGR